MISLRFIFLFVAYIALSIATMNLQTRPWVASLSFATVAWVLYAVLAAIISPPNRRVFWIGFAVFSLGWLYLHHAHPGREFYSAPAAVTEYLAGPDDVYYDRSGYEDASYDGMSSATWRSTNRLRTANRLRLRYIANCIASVVLGSIGGIAANGIQRQRVQ